jgi:class 3 adenylate cyclase
VTGQIQELIARGSGEFCTASMERRYRDSQARQELRTFRMIWLVTLGFFLLYGLADLLLYEHSRSVQLLLLRAGILLVGGAAVGLTLATWGCRLRDQISFVALILVSLLYALLLGLRADPAPGALLLLVIGMYMFSPGRYWWVVANALLCSLAALLSIALIARLSPAQWLHYSFLLPANLLAALALAQLNRIRRQNYLQRENLRAEVASRKRVQRELLNLDKRNRELLYNALPMGVARQLQRQPTRIPARHYSSVTVLFADLVGFTALARQLQPAQLLDLLNRLFSRFDKLSALHGLEKIKTVGDAYMAVAGLSGCGEQQAVSAAHFSLSLLQACERTATELGIPLQLRIGLHRGPVVGGVIGRNRFAFDVWGETVNIASRLETAATPGRILISTTVRSACEGGFVLGRERTLVLRGCGQVAACTLYSQQSGAQLAS